MEEFCKKWGFEPRHCTPEHPQANGIAERFMKVIVKVVHAAIATGQDPRIEVRRMLLNYRNTPHPSTGKSPAELMIRRPIRTRISIKMTPLRESTDLEARDKNQQVNKARKLEFDKRKHAKEVTINKGDKILIKQEKSTINQNHTW